MGNLTLEEAEAILRKLTANEILEVCKFEDDDELVAALGDYLEENLERVNEGLYEMGLV